MLVFELTMPNRGSWNGQWSQQNDRHIIIKRENEVYGKDKVQNLLETQDFYYHWDDGWTACVTVTKMDSKQAKSLKKISSGNFCGYDWMVESIMKYGQILTPSQQAELRSRSMQEKLL